MKWNPAAEPQKWYQGGVLRHDARHDKYGPHSLLDTTLPLQDTTVSWPGMTKTTKKRPRPTGWNGVVISVAVMFWQFADLDLETSLEWASPASASLEVHLLRELPSREFELPWHLRGLVLGRVVGALVGSRIVLALAIVLVLLMVFDMTMGFPGEGPQRLAS